MLNFSRFWRRIFTVCPWMVRTPPLILPFWPQIPSLTLELSQTTKENYVLEQIFKQILKFEPLSLPLFLVLNYKFDYTTQCVLIWSLFSQSFVLKSYQQLLRKTFGRVGSTSVKVICCHGNRYFNLVWLILKIFLLLLYEVWTSYVL